MSYPGTGLTDSGAPIDLSAAVGNKERKMNLEFGPVTEKLDKDGCPPLVIEPSVKKNVTLSGIPFCVQAIDDGAAGSTYRTYSYTTTVGKQIVALQFQIRHLTDNRIVGGCETDADQAKQTCKDLVFDPVADTALFDQIAGTFTLLK